MKRSLAISIILHALVIALALFLAPREEKERQILVTELVSPPEPQKPVEKTSPAEKKQKPKIRRSDSVRTGEKGIPKKLSAAPKGKKTDRGKSPARDADKKTSAISKPKVKSPVTSGVKEPTLHEKLFDRSVIDKRAASGKGRAKSVESRGVAFDVGSEKHYGWIQRFSEKVSAVWKYPPDLLKMGIFSDVYVRITVSKNGELKRAELIRTSGYRSIDESALRALREANPYWPLPDDWNEDELVIIGRFYVP